jgi:hypothetical protein
MSSNPWNGNHNLVTGGNVNVSNHNDGANVNVNGNNNGNSNSNNNNNNNNNHDNTITSTHLLAANFVPNNLREINTAMVSTIIQTKPSPSMENEIRRVFYSLVGGNSNTGNEMKINHQEAAAVGGGGSSDPATYFGNPAAAAAAAKMNQQYNNQNISHCFSCQCVSKQQCTDCPKPIKTTREEAFANDQAQKRRLLSSIPSINREMVGLTDERDGTTQHYISVFRELLQVEYAETRRLYEQAYNQYKAELSIPKALSTDHGKSNQGVAEIKVMGIADGRPSLRPGDKALIRPHGLVPIPVKIPSRGNNNNNTTNNNPIPYNNNNLPPQNFSSHPSQQAMYHHPKPQMVEVDARVLSVTRGNHNRKNKENRKDHVFISWVEDKFLDSQLKHRKCNVKFIPSSETHEACLTALSWLRSIDPAVARDLLFPSQSPKLPPPPAVDENIGDESEYEILNANQVQRTIVCVNYFLLLVLITFSLIN